MTAAEAKANFAESLRAAEQGGVVVITRYGRPVAALINYQELEQLGRLRSSRGIAHLVGRWDDADELARELDTLERSASRPLPDL